MKSLILKWIVLVTIFIPSIALCAVNPRGLVVYAEPPTTYAESVEFYSLTETSVAFATAVLTSGKRQEIPRSGILAVIPYPPEVPTDSLQQQADAALRCIQTVRSKYPQFTAKLDAAQTKWSNSLELYRQRQRLPKTAPPNAAPTMTLEVDGVTYTEVILTSFDGASVGIEHSAGAARIPATHLKSEQITALNATSFSAHIDPSKIVASKSATSSSGTPLPTKKGSAASVASSARPSTPSKLLALFDETERSIATARERKASEDAGLLLDKTPVAHPVVGNFALRLEVHQDGKDFVGTEYYFFKNTGAVTTVRIATLNRLALPAQRHFRTYSLEEQVLWLNVVSESGKKGDWELSVGLDGTISNSDGQKWERVADEIDPGDLCKEQGRKFLRQATMIAGHEAGREYAQSQNPPPSEQEVKNLVNEQFATFENQETDPAFKSAEADLGITVNDLKDLFATNFYVGYYNLGAPHGSN